MLKNSFENVLNRSPKKSVREKLREAVVIKKSQITANNTVYQN